MAGHRRSDWWDRRPAGRSWADRRDAGPTDSAALAVDLGEHLAHRLDGGRAGAGLVVAVDVRLPRVGMAQ